MLADSEVLSAPRGRKERWGGGQGVNVRHTGVKRSTN